MSSYSDKHQNLQEYLDDKFQRIKIDIDKCGIGNLRAKKPSEFVKYLISSEISVEEVTVSRPESKSSQGESVDQSKLNAGSFYGSNIRDVVRTSWIVDGPMDLVNYLRIGSLIKKGNTFSDENFLDNRALSSQDKLDIAKQRIQGFSDLLEKESKQINDKVKNFVAEMALELESYISERIDKLSKSNDIDNFLNS